MSTPQKITAYPIGTLKSHETPLPATETSLVKMGHSDPPSISTLRLTFVSTVNVQAPTVLPHFNQTLNQIRTQITVRVDPDNDHEHDPHLALLNPASPASNVLKPVTSQFYNELSH
ncbi:hypothetical protein BV22DRAFT_1135549 [Leucogyrophana mollusca]|uniref:Uncharacterized protein n=1 Tax=Leucogyrophana mollusca TaxID=85980 RepID=A0ACB8AUT8_9AGAM|nr:hypothetical protein BV22DRAFT_1135549 [Leucogyrophana mollusca]